MIYAENILLCIVVPFIISMFFVRGEVRRYLVAFLLGMGASLISAYISGFVGLVSVMSENDTSIFISPMVEETIKLILLLFFLILIVPKDKTLVMIAVAIGAGFSTFENCCYILTFGAESLTYVMIRGLAVGVMHVVSILSLALWLIFIKRLKAYSFSGVVGGLSLAMIFHSLYNLLVSEPGLTRVIGYLLPLLTALCIYPVFRRTVRSLEE
ncbi:MAG: PrsW family intramembrane metalloprotease [Lachnospiraceae bacterium]|nr:PrsW family intramembrane metalloprotease [Lachnospiraceae bacterium]